MATSQAPLLFKTEDTYFLRFTNLMFKWARRAVRVFFDQKHPPRQLAADLKKAKPTLKRLKLRHLLNEDQWTKLFNKQYPVQSTDFDITLLICLLRNIDNIQAPLTGFDILPLTSDLSEGADLARIKHYRNTVAHPVSGEMSESEFNRCWGDVEGAIRRLAAGARWLPDIQNLKTSKLDSADREVLMELQAILLEVATIPQSEKVRMRRQIENWRESDALYYETRATRYVNETTKTSNCILVTGKPGAGKSALVQHVALKLLSKGFTVLPISNPSQIDKYYDPDSLQVFVLHDPFGEYKMDEHAIGKWYKQRKELHKCFRSDQGDHNIPNMKCILLISSSSLVANTPKLRELKSYFDFKTIDINDATLKLSLEERKQIIKSYFGDKVNISNVVLELHDNLPLICKIFSKNKEFLKNPDKYIKNPLQAYAEELRIMRALSPYRYCTLAGFVFMPEIFAKDVIEKEDKDTSFDCTMKRIYASTRSGQAFSKDLLAEAFDELSGLYIYNVLNRYTILHRTLLDIIGFILCEDLVEYVLKYAPYSFIQSRIRPTGKLPSDDTDDNFYICLNNQSRVHFIKRTYCELLNHNFQLVFTNPCMPNKTVETELLAIMREDDNLRFVTSSFIHTRTENLVNFQSCTYWKATASALRLHVLTCSRTQLLHWIIAYGWSCFFNTYYIISNSEHLEIESLTTHRDYLFVLALFSGDLDIVIFVKQIIYENMLKKYSCFHCQEQSTITNRKHNDDCCMNMPFAFIPTLQEDAQILEFVLNFMRVPCGPTSDETDLYMNTSLMLASHFGYSNIMDILIQKGANVNALNSESQTALMLACAQGHIDGARMLISQNALANTLNCLGRSALYYACKNGHVSIVQLLLEDDEVMDICDQSGMTPLLVAYKYERFDVIKLLLANKVDTHVRPPSFLNVQDINGEHDFMEGYADLIDKLKSMASVPPSDSVYEKTEELVNTFYYNCNITRRETLLTLACFHGNVEVISLLLSCKMDINSPDQDGNTPLMIACKHNYENIVRMLLQNGARVDEHNTLKSSPLLWACEHGNVLMTKMLLSHYANPDKKNIYGESALFIACKMNQEVIADLLIAHGADVNTVNMHGETPLSYACKHNYHTIVSLLLATWNINHSSVYANDITPLMLACKYGHVQITKQLLDRGAILNCQDSNTGSTCLMNACIIGNTEIVSMLLQNGADVNLKSRSSETPFTLVCKLGRTELGMMMLQQCTLDNENTKTGFINAVGNGDKVIVNCILQKTTCVNTKLALLCEETLTTALKNMHTEVAYLILTHTGKWQDWHFLKEHVNRQDSEGMSMLHFASSHGDISIVEMLTNEGADVNLSNMFQSSCLAEAVSNSHLDVVSLLLDRNADPNLGDDFKDTPLHVAVENGHWDICRFLLMYGAHVNAIDDDGKTPLMIACEHGNVEIIKALIGSGALLDAQDKSGSTALMKATSRHLAKTVHILLYSGADVKIKAFDGSTALSIAETNDLKEICNLIKNEISHK